MALHSYGGHKEPLRDLGVGQVLSYKGDNLLLGGSEAVPSGRGPAPGPSSPPGISDGFAETERPPLQQRLVERPVTQGGPHDHQRRREFMTSRSRPHIADKVPLALSGSQQASRLGKAAEIGTSNGHQLEQVDGPQYVAALEGCRQPIAGQGVGADRLTLSSC